MLLVKGSPQNESVIRTPLGGFETLAEGSKLSFLTQIGQLLEDSAARCTRWQVHPSFLCSNLY